MAGYIGQRSVTLSTTVANAQDVTATDTTPEVTIINNTHEDTDGGREGKVIFKGQQSGGEESTLAEIEANHSGSSDDEKGQLVFRTNDGNDGASPTERLRIDSNGSILTATLGTDNVHLGEGAGDSIASGGNLNVTIGKDAGTAITTGTDNTFVGSNAGDALIDSDHNVAIGHQSLTADTKGSKSVAVGAFSLNAQNFSSATDSHNTAVGYVSGAAITTGIENTLIGALSGDAITTGNYNVAMGVQALSANVEGSKSTAIGQQALYNQTPSSAADMHNTAVGFQAGLSVTTGTKNIAVGASAGSQITTGGANVCIGYQSGDYSQDLTTGSKNVLIGAYTRTYAEGEEGANVFGYNVSGDGGYTTIGQDANDTRLDHGGTTWATVSDERYKKDITDSTVGLSFVNTLRPRTFNYKNKGELPDTFAAYEEGSTEVFKSNKTQHGFIAQEVKAAIDADSSVKDGFKFWNIRSDGSQEVGETALIPMLTKAIQELSAKNDALETRIAALEAE